MNLPKYHLEFSKERDAVKKVSDVMALWDESFPELQGNLGCISIFMSFFERGGLDEASPRDGFLDHVSNMLKLYSLLVKKGDIIIRKQYTNDSVVFDEGSKEELSNILFNWLDEAFMNPYLLAGLKSEKEWHEDIPRILKNINEDQIFWQVYENGLKFFYSFCDDNIPWNKGKAFDSITDKYIFLYRLGSAFQLFDMDSSLDLSHYSDRQTLAKSIKSLIVSQKNWEKKNGKSSIIISKIAIP